MYHICYNSQQYRIKRTQHFSKWLEGLKDSKARIQIGTRIERFEAGNPGDHKRLGEISELRVDYGPGYRLYYMHQDREIIIMLTGGDKGTQEKDIEVARKIARCLREKRNDG